MRYKIFMFILTIIIIVFGIVEVNALEVMELNPTIQIGETKNIELYANVPDNTKQLDFSLSFLSYDAIGTFETSTGILTTNGSKYSISFEEPVGGRIKIGNIKIKISNSTDINTSTINLYNATATSLDNIRTKLNNQSIQVNITKQVEEIKTNLLKSITSNIVDISLEPNKYEYDILVNEKVDKLDLIATPIDETYEINISDQFLKVGVNQIFITVSKDDITEKYIINVTKKESLTETDNIIEKKDEIIKKNKTSKLEKQNFKSKWIIIMIGLIVLFIGGVFMLIKNKIR